MWNYQRHVYVKSLSLRRLEILPLGLSGVIFNQAASQNESKLRTRHKQRQQQHQFLPTGMPNPHLFMLARSNNK